MRVALCVCLLSPLKRCDYGGEILRADTCRLCARLGVTIGKKMNILYNLPKENKTQLAECHIPYTVPSANIFTIQRVYGRRLMGAGKPKMECAMR